MPKATLNLQDGGAIIVLHPDGSLGGAVYDTDTGSDGAILAEALCKCMENKQWVAQVCQKVRNSLQT